MTMQINIKDQFLDQFQSFINSLPKNAIEVNNVDDNSITFDQTKEKVSNAINNLPLNKGIDIDSAFDKVMNY